MKMCIFLHFPIKRRKKASIGERTGAVHVVPQRRNGPWNLPGKGSETGQIRARQKNLKNFKKSVDNRKGI